jgi:3'-phosphoadenosine 5'-phosphosulfate sulfotransferase (PAPS reductase)/FAD synthetase
LIENKIQLWQLQQRQAMPLWMKIEYSKKRIIDWYNVCEGKIYVPDSGGVDSQVALHLTRTLFPKTVAVFVDTGLEYPENKQIIKETDNIVIVKPKMRFDDVIKKYGYPIISKKVARSIRDMKNPSDKNKHTRNLYLTGLTQNGTPCPSRKLANRWMKLINAPFNISEQCCDVLKKEPIKRYEKETGNFPIIATMTEESRDRTTQYLQLGCNSFESKTKRSTPLAFWKKEDVWAYIKENKIKYSSVYDKGEKRTGCIFCMFGIMSDTKPNRFQRLKRLHPKLYDYCIDDLGIGACLDYINVPYGDYRETRQAAMF